MSITTGWRTLAEPTYGVSDSHPAGAVAQLDAGLVVRVSEGPSAEIAEVEIRLKDGKPAPVRWYVTASGLRFAEGK